MVTMTDARLEKSKQKKNVTTACRKRKSKCDVKLPSCTSCKTYGQHCAYEFGADKRKIPSKTAIEYLTARVYLLEQTVNDSLAFQRQAEAATIAAPYSLQANDLNSY